MPTRAQILRLLADGSLHSGSEIGRRLGISRAAVCKAVHALGARGLAVQAVPGRGYRLETPITPLDRRRIVHLLGSAAPPRIEILEQVRSTNGYLLERAHAVPDPSGMVCLAEVQPQGRGRRGRSWVATPYQNLMMSMAWRYRRGPEVAAGLSIAAGVAVARALESYGVDGVGIKWPNDILWKDRKLAGLLVDVHGEASGPCTVVLGVGINCRIAPADGERIGQPWVDLHGITGATPDRNRLAALLLRHLQEVLTGFAVSGLAAFIPEWSRRHVYDHRPVRLARDDASFEGTVEGIDAAGALRLRTAHGEIRVFHSGDVSLRPAP